MESQIEKQEFDEAEKDPVVYFDPQRIPIEVWNQILRFIIDKDLLSLSLVCKTFYEIIENLPEAMDKLELKLIQTTLQTLKDVELIFESSRNYTNIRLEDIDVCDIEVCRKVLTKFGGNLRILEFRFCYFAEDEFTDILKMTQKNLRTLKFCYSKFTENSRSTSTLAPKTFKFIELQTLKICTHGNTILKLLNLMPNTLLEVIYDIEFIKLQPQFYEFLEKQKYLKRLCLSTLENSEFLNTIIDDARIKFKLEKLEISIREIEEEPGSYKNLDQFLKPHTKSLKELRLSNVLLNSLNSAFENMPNLQLLRIELLYPRIELNTSGPQFNCPSLKSLMIDWYGAEDSYFLNFFLRFKNVQEIILENELDDTSNIRRLIEIIAKNHPNLKMLALDIFDDDAFKYLSFKNLTTLRISRIRLYDTEEETVVPAFSFENSIYAMENLEILKLGSANLATMTSLLFILVNFKKLKHLEINNGTKLSDDLLCRHLDFFKNLRFLKILDVPVENFITGLSQFPNLKYSFSENDDD